LAKNLSYDSTTVTLANTATVTAPIECTRGRIPLALVIPAGLTGTSFTFNVSSDGVTFYPLYYEATAYTVTVASSRHVALDRRAFEGVKHMKITSGTAQSGAIVIGVVQGE
jgi:hypothetical protein